MLILYVDGKPESDKAQELLKPYKPIIYQSESEENAFDKPPFLIAPEGEFGGIGDIEYYVDAFSTEDTE